MLNSILLWINGSQWLIILILILLLFGGRKIPELMRGLGRGVKEFKNGLDEAKNDIDKSMKSLDDNKNDLLNKK